MGWCCQQLCGAVISVELCQTHHLSVCMHMQCSKDYVCVLAWPDQGQLTVYCSAYVVCNSVVAYWQYNSRTQKGQYAAAGHVVRLKRDMLCGSAT